MANVYVRSGAAGAGTGADWANAYTTLAAALTAKAAGDDFWVAADHAETQTGNMTLTSPGTAAAPCRIICVNQAGTVPPVSADLRTTATISTTTTGTMSLVGHAYCEGVTFSAGSVANNTSISICTAGSAGLWKLMNCGFVLNTTSTTATILLLTSSASFLSEVEWRNVTVKFGAVAQTIRTRFGSFLWRGGSIDAAGSVPTNLFSVSCHGCRTVLEGVDLSHLSGTLVPTMTGGSLFHFKDCKLHASVTVAAAQSVAGAEIFVTRCSDTAGNFQHRRINGLGEQSVETTIILTGGASDGVTSVAHKIVTTANAKRYLPFESTPIAKWNDVSGVARTIEVQGIWGGGAVPNNIDIWLFVEYLGVSGNPLGSFISDGAADILAAGAAQDAGTGTWGGSTTKFKLAVTFTPAQKGTIYAYVRAGLASSTFYINPELAVS